MDPQAAALENLRVIRSLMGRATEYRAISAPAALVGGLLAAGASGYLFFKFSVGGAALTPGIFLGLWLSVLAAATLCNLALLARAAAKRGEPAFNPSFRTALAAVLPPLLVGGVFGIAAALHGAYLFTALLWTAAYGLALLATRSFAPRSIRCLGYAFLLTSLAVAGTLIGTRPATEDLMDDGLQESLATILLGDTFGLYHLIYGIAVLATGGRKKPNPERPAPHGA